MTAPQSIQPMTDEPFDIKRVLRFHTHSARVFDKSNDTVVVNRTLLRNAADRIEELERDLAETEAEVDAFSTVSPLQYQKEAAAKDKHIEELKAALREFVAAYKLQDCDNYTEELARAYSIADAALQSSTPADQPTDPKQKEST